jgi:hypothetical protein
MGGSPQKSASGGVCGGGDGQRRGKLLVAKRLRAYCQREREIELELIVQSWQFGRVNQLAHFALRLEGGLSLWNINTAAKIL